LVIEELSRRPAAEFDRAEIARCIHVAAGVGAAHLARQIRENDDAELEPLRLVHGHQPNAVAAFFDDRRLGSF
jgi:hypothetical protein